MADDIDPLKTALDLACSRDYNDFREVFDNSHPPEADYLAVERLLREGVR